MPLWLHLLIHFSFAVFVGWTFYRASKLFWVCFLAGILGGFLIDVDHVIEYFLVFHNFSFLGFINGWQFLWSGKNYLIFHAWEYLPFFLILAYLIRRWQKIAIFLAVFSIAGAVHLASDCLINEYSPRFYSLIYRSSQGFSAEKLLPARNLELNRKEYQKWFEAMKKE